MNSVARLRYTPQMELLCKTIPALRNVVGTVPWDPHALASQWLVATDCTRAAITFVISVWDHADIHQGEPSFTVADFRCLDEANQRAVAAWFATPFWPGEFAE